MNTCLGTSTIKIKGSILLLIINCIIIIMAVVVEVAIIFFMYEVLKLKIKLSNWTKECAIFGEKANDRGREKVQDGKHFSLS